MTEQVHLNLFERFFLNTLTNVYKKLRQETKDRYNRMNPFYEDLFSWKERGAFWSKDEKGITVYNSATVIGSVDIGRNTWVGPFTILDGSGGLKIGSHCSVAAGVKIMTHDTVKWALSAGKHAYEYDSSSIGDNCFIGSHSIITKGVKIGDHCLIAAGAVVTKSFPAFSIIAGVPAEIIGSVQLTSDYQVVLKYFNNLKT